MRRRIFRSLDSFFQTDTRYLISGSFWLLFAKGVGLLVSFALSLIYARYLSKDIYGSYRYILSTLSLFGIFALPGMATAITRGVARGFEGTFRQGTRVIFLSSLGIAVAGVATAFVLALRGESALFASFIIAGLLAPFLETVGGWRGFYDGKKNFRAKTVTNIVIQATYGLAMAAGVWTIASWNLGIATGVLLLVSTYSLSQIIPNLLIYAKTLQNVPSGAPSEPGAIRYGLLLSLSNIPVTIANYLDSVLLYAFLGPASVAVYSFALAPIEQLKSFMGTAATVSMPKLSDRTYGLGDMRMFKRNLWRKVWRTVAISLAITSAYVIAAPYLFAYLFPAYGEAVSITRILALWLVLFPFGVFATAMKAEGDIRAIYAYETISPIIQIALFIALIPSYGLVGAALAKTMGRTFHHLMLAFFYR